MNFKAHQELWNPLSKALPGKFHGPGGRDKCNCFQERANFHRSWAWKIVQILNADNLLKSKHCRLKRHVKCPIVQWIPGGYHRFGTNQITTMFVDAQYLCIASPSTSMALTIRFFFAVCPVLFSHLWWWVYWCHIDGLVQEKRNSSALSMEFRLSCTNPSIWRHRIRSMLTQVMTCCLTAPSHYLNQCWLRNGNQGPVSISDKTSYFKISWSLEAARFVIRIVRSLWNLAGTSAAPLPKCLSNFKVKRKLKLRISRLRDFTRSYDKTSYLILKRGPGVPTIYPDLRQQ